MCVHIIKSAARIDWKLILYVCLYLFRLYRYRAFSQRTRRSWFSEPYKHWLKRKRKKCLSFQILRSRPAFMHFGDYWPARLDLLRSQIYPGNLVFLFCCFLFSNFQTDLKHKNISMEIIPDFESRLGVVLWHHWAVKTWLSHMPQSICWTR